jgi:hypothetical protein
MNAAELNVSHVQTTNPSNNKIAIKTEDRVGGRRTITASSLQPNSTGVAVGAGITIESRPRTSMVRLAR